MALNKVSDEESRTKALNPIKSYIVQAPAGSGKTELLTQRVLHLLATVNKPEEIVALTFTKKAASEMKSRIIDALLTGNSSVVQKIINRDKSLGWNLLKNPNRLNIMTIDALCAKIVHKMPVLSKIGTSVSICDNPDVYYKQAVYELFKLVNTNIELDTQKDWINNLKILFKHFGGSYTKLQNFLLSMLYKRDQWLPYLSYLKDKDDYAKYEYISAAFDKLASDVILNIENKIPLDIKTELGDILNYASDNLIQSLDNHGINQQCIIDFHSSNTAYWQAVAILLFTQDESLSFRKTIDKRLGFIAKGSEKKKLLDIISDLNRNHDLDDLLDSFALLKKLPKSTYSLENWELLVTLANVLILLEAELRIIFRKNNTTDFQGVSQGAIYALGDIGGDTDGITDIGLWLDYKIKHILVDEFQDTSYIQYQLLCKLTAGWDGSEDRTLFLVGDPMQSIYKFRQADVSLFLRVIHNGVGDVQLEYLRLSKNFRSEQQIVNWVNTKFIHILPKGSNMIFGAIKYSSSEPTRELNQEFSPKLYVFDRNDEQSENNFIIEHVKRIISLNQKDAPSIAILVRNRTRVIELIRAFKNNRLKFNAIDIELLSDKMVIQDLLSLTCAILNFSDRTAWYSVLRAPWCGLSLKDLYLLHFGNSNKNIIEILHEDFHDCGLSDYSKKKLNNLLFVLRNVQRNLYKINFYKIIEQAWYSLGGNLIYNSEQDILDAKQYFDLLFRLEESNYITDINQLLVEVSRLYSGSKIRSEHEGSVYNIEIMTIHKSKGLQFDYVILPYLDQSAKISEHEMLAWQTYHADNFDGIMLAPYYIKDHEQAEFYQTLRYIEKQKESYELARLLYVAVTRAKKSCIFTASCDLDKGKSVEDIKATSTSMLCKILDKLNFEEVVFSDITKADNTNIKYDADNINNNQLYKYIDPSTYSSEAIINSNSKELYSEYLRVKTRDMFPRELPNDNPTTYELKDDSQRLIGVFVHKMLYNIVKKYININVPDWLDKKILTVWRNSLLNMGMPLNNLNKALDIIVQAINNVVDDGVGQWIISDYQTSFAEKDFFYYHKQELKKSVIDRLFIDKKIIWIIDYKLGNTDEDFKRQLSHYEYLVKSYFKDIICTQNLTVKSALYYPLTKEFVCDIKCPV